MRFVYYEETRSKGQEVRGHWCWEGPMFACLSWKNHFYDEGNIDIRGVGRG